jgi:hypothetical protein
MCKIFLEQPFTRWKSYLDQVVNTINFHSEKTFKSLQNQLLAYFTEEKKIIPQSQESMYKFSLNDIVNIDVLPRNRKELGFKYSLNSGKINKNLKGIIKQRKLLTKNNILIPMYVVQDIKSKQVYKNVFYINLCS